MCTLLGGCLLGDADGEAPPPASSARVAASMLSFNPSVMAGEDGTRSGGPLLLPRTLDPMPAQAASEDATFDEGAFVSRDVEVLGGRIEGVLGTRDFDDATGENFGWYTSWEFDGQVESYLSFEVAAVTREGAGMLIISFEGDLEPLLDEMGRGSTIAREVPQEVNAWVATCYGDAMYEWDADLPAAMASVSMRADPEDPQGVVFDVEATFGEDEEPVHGQVRAVRSDLEEVLTLVP